MPARDNSRANPAADDKRPLDKEGIEQCRDVGRLLSTLDVHVDLIISSPLKRATQTASLVGNELGYDSKLILDPALSPNGAYEDFRELLRRHGKLDAVMVVGHNPSISRFLSLMVTNGAFDKAVDMKKGSVARVDFESKQPVLELAVDSQGCAQRLLGLEGRKFAPEDRAEIIALPVQRPEFEVRRALRVQQHDHAARSPRGCARRLPCRAGPAPAPAPSAATARLWGRATGPPWAERASGLLSGVGREFPT